MAKKRNFTCGTNAGNPKWAKWAHLAPLGSQLECKVCFILPTRGSSWRFFVFSIEVAGLSLRAGGRGFSPATNRVAPSYFYWKIEEK